MKKIIHVDNSSFFRKFMGSFLAREGFEVESFDNAQDSTLAISSGAVDMVILGLTFADAEGDEFLKKVQNSFSGPIIVVSSSVKKHEAKLMSYGIKDAICKTGAWQDRLRLHLSALK
ncbi:MAG: response regulator [Treponema sp.]|jgi:DNA-binding response OmpR family regulator|nr:response regulator [Treponema sp.]